jgi:transposase
VSCLPAGLQHLEQQINDVSQELQVIAKSRDDCSRLMTVPGIGPLAATAMIAAVGKGNPFRRTRDLAAWLGLVPKQHSTGGTPRLPGISNRGNNYPKPESYGQLNLTTTLIR